MRHAVAIVLVALPAVLSSSCSGPTAPPPAGTVMVHGTLKDALGGQPLVNVEVCVKDHDDIPCVRSDLQAKFDLSVPKNSEIELSFFLTGYYQHLATMTSKDAEETINYSLLSDTGMDLMAGTANIEIDGTQGQVIFGADTARTDGQTVDGVTVTLSPVAGQGPFYQGDNGIDRGLTATSAKGRGGLFNVPPGDYEMTFSHPTRSCSATNWAWAGTTTGAARFRAVRGFSTYVSMICN